MFSDSFSFGGAEGGFLADDSGFGSSVLETSTFEHSIYSPFAASVADAHRRNCIALTVGLIYKSFQSHSDATRVVINGEEIATFKLVGTVHDFEIIEDGGAEKFRFTLDDGTGRIKVDWLVGLRNEEMSQWMRKNLNDFANEAQHPFYVKVFGETNLRGIHEPRVRAIAVHQLQNHMEIMYHTLQVINQHAFTARKPPTHENGPPLNQKPEPRRPTTAVQQPLPVQPPPQPTGRPSTAGGYSQGPPTAVQTTPIRQPPTPARPPTKPAAGQDLKERILEYLQSMADSHPQGVHVKVIAKECGTTAEIIRENLQELEDSGDAFFGKNHDFWSAV